jgi:hypothetical protein
MTHLLMRRGMTERQIVVAWIAMETVLCIAAFVLMW